MFTIDRKNRYYTIPIYPDFRKLFTADEKPYILPIIDAMILSYTFHCSVEDLLLYEYDSAKQFFIDYLSTNKNLKNIYGDTKTRVLENSGDFSNSTIIPLANRAISFVNELSDDDLKLLVKHLITGRLINFDGRSSDIINVAPALLKYYDIVYWHRGYPQYITLNNIHLNINEAKAQAFFDRSIRSLIEIPI